MAARRTQAQSATLLADAAPEVAAYLDGGPIGMAVPHTRCGPAEGSKGSLVRVLADAVDIGNRWSVSQWHYSTGVGVSRL